MSKFLPAGGFKDFFCRTRLRSSFVSDFFSHTSFNSRAGGWVFWRYMWLPGVILLVGAAAFAANNSTTAGLAPNVRYLAWGVASSACDRLFYQVGI
jgi:hypothetical protein